MTDMHDKKVILVTDVHDKKMTAIQKFHTLVKFHEHFFTEEM